MRATAAARAPSLNRPARASVAYTATHLMLKAVSLLLLPLFTRLLTTAEYGEYPLFLSRMSLLSLFATWGIGGHATYRGLALFHGGAERYLRARLLLMLCTGLTTGAGLLLLYRHTPLMQGIAGWQLALALLMSLTEGVLHLTLATWRYGYRYGCHSLLSLISGLLPPLLSLLLITRGGMGGKGRIVGGVLSSLLLALPCIRRLLWPAAHPTPTDSPTDSRGHAAGHPLSLLLLYELPLLPQHLASVILSTCDKLLLARLGTEAALGRYSLASSAALALVGLGSGAAGALCPWLTRRVRAGEFARIRRTLTPLLELLLPLTVLFLALVPEVFRLLAPASYADALPVIYLLTPAVLPLLLTSMLSTAILATGRSTWCSLPAIVSALLALALLPAVLTHLPYQAVAGVMLLCHLVQMLLTALLLRRESGHSLCSARRLVATLSLLLLASLILYLLRGLLLLRLAVALGAAVALLPAVRRLRPLWQERQADGTPCDTLPPSVPPSPTKA